MSIRKIALGLVVLAATSSSSARADFGLGIFFGQPTGLDFKLGLTPRSGLDILVGFHDEFYENDGNYAHLTYLVDPIIARGRNVIVPVRIGIGFALIDDGARVGDGLHAAVRAPVQIGLRFRSVPLEIYGEISLLYQFRSGSELDLDGGIGFRLYL